MYLCIGLNVQSMEDSKNMTRRDALKAMGAMVATAALATAGLSSFAAPVKNLKDEKAKKRLVFYFTATGNSLYVARAFSAEPVSIPQALKEGKLEYEADEIGIVFPDFAAAAPLMVREFVEKARLKAPYIFSVITFGNFAANVADWWDDFCKQKGVASQYINTLLMVDNYLPVFDMNEQVKIDKHIPENLAQIVADVEARREFISHVDADDRMRGWLKRLQDDHFPMEAFNYIMENAEIKPQMAQIECHPLAQRKEARQLYANNYDVQVECWYPLNHNRGDVSNTTLLQIAATHNRTVYQIILRWHMQEGLCPVPGSTNPDHILENISIFDFSLSDEEMEAIRAIDRGEAGRSFNLGYGNWGFGNFQDYTYNHTYEPPTAIETPRTSTLSAGSQIYTLQGQQVSTPQRGVNIIQQSDGTARKILMR